MRVGVLLVLSFLLGGCAAGISTYEYQHMSDGSTWVKVRSANEISQMEMGINRETGTLEVKIGELTKKSEVATVVTGIDSIVGNLTKFVVPGGGQ